MIGLRHIGRAVRAALEVVDEDRDVRDLEAKAIEAAADAVAAHLPAGTQAVAVPLLNAVVRKVEERLAGGANDIGR